MIPRSPRPLVIAHRGGRHDGVTGEQTLAHLERAIALGAVPVTSRELIRRLLDSGLRQRKRHREIPG